MRRNSFLAALSLVAILAIVGCSQPAPAAPTAAPQKAAAAPTTAPAAPAPTAAPAKPTQAPPQPTAVPKVTFPEKGRSISMIVPFSAGGGADIAARAFAPLLEKELGVPVQILNKPGAATQTAMSELVKSKPDGYTLGITPLPSVAVPYLDDERKTGYGRGAFQPIANFSLQDIIPAVKADNTRFKTMKDVIDAARANPEKVKYGDSGILGNTHLLALGLASETGVKFAHVHFGGGGESVVALLGGHIDIDNTASTDVLPHYKSKEARLLATAGPNQSTFFPDVPTLASQGFKATTVYVVGFSGPAGMPKDVVDVLSTAAKKAATSPDLKTKLNALASEVDFMDAAQYATFWADYEKKLGPLIEMGKAQTK